jgi:hypothetical protein
MRALTGILQGCKAGSGEARCSRNRRRRAAAIRGGKEVDAGEAGAPGFGSLARSKEATMANTVDTSGKREGLGGRGCYGGSAMAASGEVGR